MRSTIDVFYLSIQTIQTQLDRSLMNFKNVCFIYLNIVSKHLQIFFVRMLAIQLIECLSIWRNQNKMFNIFHQLFSHIAIRQIFWEKISDEKLNEWKLMTTYLFWAGMNRMRITFFTFYFILLTTIPCFFYVVFTINIDGFRFDCDSQLHNFTTYSLWFLQRITIRQLFRCFICLTINKCIALQMQPN